MKHIKKIISTITALALILTMHSGCGMFTNYKAIAEQALEDKYGEEFICYSTWDEGTKNFYAKCSPKNDNIMFSANISLENGILYDKYIERVVAQKCYAAISSQIGKLCTNYSYYASINAQSHSFVSKSDVSINEYFVYDDDSYPILFIAIGLTNEYITPINYSEEYKIIESIATTEELNAIKEMCIDLYYIPFDYKFYYEEYFNNALGIQTDIEELPYSRNHINFVIKDKEITISEDEYITYREDMNYV